MIIREAFLKAEEVLREAGVMSAGFDTCALLSEILHEPLSHLPARMRCELSSQQANEFQTLIQRRATREPLAYILGWTEFMGLRFTCEPGVFIPRPDTEILVETVLRQNPVRSGSVSIVEICAGTGCIGISLAHYLPQAQVYMTDLNAVALALVQKNGAINNVADRIHTLHGANVEPLVQVKINQTAQILVANPPYIPTSDIKNLEPEVACSEPVLALDGGPDGLDFYREVLPQIVNWPNLQLVAFEFGIGQENQVADLMKNWLTGWQVDVCPDLSGLPRVAVAERV